MSKATVSLATLSLKLRDAAQPGKRIILNRIQGHRTDKVDRDFLDEVTSILTHLLNSLAVSSSLSNAAKITRLDSNDRYIKGIIEIGRTGTIQNILDIDTSALSYQTKLKDAVMQPHYFLFYIPEEQHKAVVFLQRYKQIGIQTLLFEYLEREFKKEFPKFGFKIDYLTDTDTFNKMLDSARVKEIRLTENAWSSDRSDNTNGPREKKGSLSVTYKPYRSTGSEYLDLIKRIGARELEFGNALELPIDFMNPDEASFVIARKGRKDRRISFTDTSTNFRSYYDITTDVKLGENGYPTFESVDKIAVEILTELSQGLYEPTRKD